MMVRINLLPSARKQARGSASSGDGSATPWIVGYIGATFVAGLVCALLYFNGTSELEEQRARNQALQAQITAAQAQSADLEQVRAQLAQSEDLERVVGDLQRARYGPTRVLMELSHILSASGGPTVDPERLEAIRRDNPLAGFNPAWDTRRLWLTSFVEEERHVQIQGLGKTNEDVAEFLRRLSLSESFNEVQLTKTEATTDAATHIDLISFELSCSVVY